MRRYFLICLGLLWSLGAQAQNPRNAIPAPDTLSIPQGMDARKVIARYLEAIGGEERVQRIKSSIAHMQGRGEILSLNTSLGFAQVDMKHVAVNGRYYKESSIGGALVATLLFDGQQEHFDNPHGKAMVPSYAHPQVVGLDAYVVPEAAYESLGCRLELLGMVPFEDHYAYAVEVRRQDAVWIDLFDAQSHLKVRRVEHGGFMTDYQDYRSVAGVLLPHQVNLPIFYSNPLLVLSLGKLPNFSRFVRLPMPRIPMDVRWEVNASEAKRIFRDI